jgi:hypothetical protein
LDIYIVDKNLGLEYIGEQHYKDVYQFGPQWIYRERQKNKKQVCEGKNISLVEIPYWWDSTKESLLATIKLQRSDIQVEGIGQALPIPSEPPK